MDQFLDSQMISPEKWSSPVAQALGTLLLIRPEYRLQDRFQTEVNKYRYKWKGRREGVGYLEPVFDISALPTIRSYNSNVLRLYTGAD